MILSLHSEVFSAMFKSGMKEATSGELAITIFSKDTVVCMLQQCIYDPMSDVTVPQMGLFKIADHFGVHSANLRHPKSAS